MLDRLALPSWPLGTEHETSCPVTAALSPWAPRVSTCGTGLTHSGAITAEPRPDQRSSGATLTGMRVSADCHTLLRVCATGGPAKLNDQCPFFGSDLSKLQPRSMIQRTSWRRSYFEDCASQTAVCFPGRGVLCVCMVCMMCVYVWHV